MNEFLFCKTRPSVDFHFNVLLVFFCVEELRSAFERHVATFGGLDICINSAGVGTHVLFHKDESDGSSTWRRTLNINLIAVVESTQIAVMFLIRFFFPLVWFFVNLEF